MRLREEQVQKTQCGEKPGVPEAQRQAMWLPWTSGVWEEGDPGDQVGEVGEASPVRALQAVGSCLGFI